MMSSWWVPCPPQVGGCWTQWTLYIQDQTDRSEGKGRHCRTLSIPSRTTDFAPWRIQRIGWIEDRTLGRDASEKWMFFQKLFFKSFLLLNGQSGIQVRPQKSTFALPTVCFFFYARHHRVEGQRILHIVFGITKLIMVALVGQVTSARERYREHFVHFNSSFVSRYGKILRFGITAKWKWLLPLYIWIFYLYINMNCAVAVNFATCV